MTTQEQANWSMRVDQVRLRAEVVAGKSVGTPHKVRLNKNTCFCGTVKNCTVEIVEVPGVSVRALYHVTLVGPTGHETTYQTYGR